ncbi:hypothetical protein KP509_24G078300 [Ceratopteris richardii]|uniref:Uncharacterized protein n=1 Tax=Ceratopteris richardii TaxID=49495 RepID=A0A8T2RWP3_CERRI|nr:hypothetical protein KP509_24G078300 [Ceratopteris richardii]
MAPMERKEVDDLIAKALKEAKKEEDRNLNMETRKMMEKFKGLEEQVMNKVKGLEEQVKTLTEERDHWRTAYEHMKEEGEISNAEILKEEIKKEIKTEVESTRESWVEVVHKRVKKEVREDVQKEELTRVQDTLEEERLRHTRRLHIRITGLPEGVSPEADATDICHRLGYESMPYTDAWRVGRDTSRLRALILKMSSEEARTAFFRRRSVLRGLPGGTLYMDEDLTRMQVAHRRACMPQILQARREGRKAFYRDGKVFIDGRPIK